MLRKFEKYGIKGTNLAWYRSYLNNRKQYIEITNNSKSGLGNTTCGVPLGSILAPLPLLVYANDPLSSSKILNAIMFANDSNLFHEHKKSTVNEELREINDCLRQISSLSLVLHLFEFWENEIFIIP